MSYKQVTTYDGTLNTNQNVLRYTFSQATSTAPELHSWDDTGHDSNAYEMLAGTTETSSSSWLKAVETTVSAPGAGWTGSDETLHNGANPASGPNDLQGSTTYVPCASAASAAGTKSFNIVSYIPSDLANAGTTGHTPVLSIVYTYTGTAPVITVDYNEGTEGTPTWTSMIAGDSLYFTGPDTTVSVIDPVQNNLPGLGSKIMEEFWIGQP